MLPITKQERHVLIALGFIFLVGMTLEYLLKTQPPINGIIQFVERKEFGSQIDLNDATLEQLIELPYIGAVTAQRIIDYRNQHGRFFTLEELRKIPGVGPSVYEKIMPLLKLAEKKS